MLKLFKHSLLRTGLVCIMLLVFIDSAISSDWKLIKPSSGKKRSIEISGKKRSYWKLDKKNKIEIKVTGPAQLKMITRLKLKDEQDEGMYSFVTHLNGKRQPLIGRATQYSKSAVDPKNKDNRFGQSRTIMLDIPPGENSYTFSLPKGSDDVVFARFLIPDIKPKKKTSYVAYLPRYFTEEVKIIVNEHEYIYYRFSSEKHLEIEVIGPTRIKCIARLEINHSMRGRKPYRIQVSEADSVVLTDFFSAEISSTAEYAEKSNTVLSRGDVFYIDVPEGNHRYSIMTPDPDINVICRFYIPEKNLGNAAPSVHTTRAGIANWK